MLLCRLVMNAAVTSLEFTESTKDCDTVELVMLAFSNAGCAPSVITLAGCSKMTLKPFAIIVKRIGHVLAAGK
jgi:hypothetical protein